MNQQANENDGLIERAKTGDKEAFVTLIQECEPLIWGILRSFSRIHNIEADDLFSEVVMKAYEILPEFKGGTLEFKSWLRKTTWGMSSNFKKKQVIAREKEYELKEFSQSTTLSPQEKCAQKERQECVRRAIGRLPEHYRKPMHLKYIEGLKYEQIAEILKIPSGTVRSRLSRGCEKLECILKELHCDDML